LGPLELVAVDWGSSNLRLRLLAGPRDSAPPRPEEAGSRGGPQVIAEHRSAEGVGTVAAGDHQRVFLENLERLLRPAGRWESFGASGGEVYFAGMVTSSLGWFPTPYLEVPAGEDDLLSGLRAEHLGDLRLHFLPGLRTAVDVMRGEEVEALGIMAAGRAGRDGEPAILVLPGTHSKWIRLEEGRIADFTTVPTGDLYAGLHQATLLARTLPPAPAAVEGHLLAGFDRGLELARREGPLSSLFKARSLSLLAGMGPQEASALVSGILIGGEVLERTRNRPPSRTLLAGGPPLQALYLRAFKTLGHSVEPVDPALSARASAEGLWSLAARARARRRTAGS
jgi:2-dehydro-3-deoxygalactonokinase